MNSEQTKVRLQRALPRQVMNGVLRRREKITDKKRPDLFAETRLMTTRYAYFTFLSDQVTAGIPCIVVACDAGDYVVQVLSVPGKAGSFVEAIVRQDDALFPFIHEKVGMLNLAGPNESIEDLGENFGKGHYNIYINPEQHSRICQPTAKE